MQYLEKPEKFGFEFLGPFYLDVFAIKQDFANV